MSVQSTKRAAIAAIGALLDREDEITVQRVADALERQLAEPDTLDERLWGPAPDPGVALAAEVGSAELAERARERILVDAYTREQAARRLGITPAAVSKRIANRTLLAVTVGREWRLPAWQFTADGVLPQLDRLADAFPSGTVALSLWASRAHPDLDGRSPARALARGEFGAVLAAARAADAAGW
jgi:hypothetical protein